MTGPEIRNLTVNAHRFAAVLNFISDEETRYYLNGVHVEPAPEGHDGALLVATNGHMLAAVLDPEAETHGRSWICPVSRRVAKLIQSRVIDRIPGLTASHIHFRGAAVYVTSADSSPGENDPAEIGPAHLLAEYAPPIDGTFPDWRRIVPRATSAEPAGLAPACLDAVKLAKFVKAATQIALAEDRCPDPRCLRIRILPTSDGGPLIIDIGEPTFFGVLMPMRSPARDMSPPPWLGLPTPRGEEGRSPDREASQETAPPAATPVPETPEPVAAAGGA